MKKKIVLFIVMSIAMAIAGFFIFWPFDAISKNPRDTIHEIKFALVLGIMTGFFTVFLTNFFRSDRK
jgi:hypothetical protein